MVAGGMGNGCIHGGRGEAELPLWWFRRWRDKEVRGGRAFSPYPFHRRCLACDTRVMASCDWHGDGVGCVVGSNRETRRAAVVSFRHHFVWRASLRKARTNGENTGREGRIRGDRYID